jgi:hypothetical protein
MSIVASDAQELRRRAWEAYAERLHGLEGAAYDDAEQEAWEELQAALPEGEDTEGEQASPPGDASV